jgi:hypothetical protein
MRSEKMINDRLPKKNQDLSWIITGFTMGEGTFSVIVENQKTNKKHYLNCQFRIGLKINDQKILYLIKNHLNCGHVYVYKKTANFVVAKLSDLLEIIIPFFEMYPLKNIKRDDFQMFKIICYKKWKGEADYANGLDRILSIREQMNSGGFNRGPRKG